LSPHALSLPLVPPTASPPTPLSPLSLHDALPISALEPRGRRPGGGRAARRRAARGGRLARRRDPHDSRERVSVAPLLHVALPRQDRKSTRLNSSHEWISYAVFCLEKNKLIYYTSI